MNTSKTGTATPPALTPDRLARNRKFYFVVMVFLLATMLCAFGRLSDAIYGEIVIYTVGLFMLGNGAEHAAQAWGKRGKREDS